MTNLKAVAYPLRVVTGVRCIFSGVVRTTFRYLKLLTVDGRMPILLLTSRAGSAMTAINGGPYGDCLANFSSDWLHYPGKSAGFGTEERVDFCHLSSRLNSTRFSSMCRFCPVSFSPQKGSISTVLRGSWFCVTNR